MSMPNRTRLGWLGAIGLALVGTGTLGLLNWDTVSKNLVAALDTQAAKTQATLFRWGELMSIGSELKARYGVEPDVTYDTSTSARTLGIRFSDDQSPEHGKTEGHAREIAAFAVASTAKFEEIDAVRVLFERPSRKQYTFARNDLMRSQPQARPAMRGPTSPP